MFEFSFIKKWQQAKEEEARRLMENPEDSSSGKRFKQLYKVGETMGRGAFSVVYEAKHRQSHKSFAVKTVNKHWLKPDDLKGMENEIEILRSLDHPHLVKLHDVFDGTDYYYLVTERFDGGDMRQRIEKKGRYNDRDGRLACKVMFEALAYVHSHSIAHRDLKLENLLFPCYENDHNVKLIDFGFAKRVTSPNGLKTMIGTPAYVAPCLLQGVGYGVKADVWSLGVILFIMLSGYPPFQDGDRQKLFQKIIKGKYEMIESRWKDVSDEAKDLVIQLLTKDPAKRPSSEEVLHHAWLTTETSTKPEEEEAAPTTAGGLDPEDAVEDPFAEDDLDLSCMPLYEEKMCERKHNRRASSPVSTIFVV